MIFIGTDEIRALTHALFARAKEQKMLDGQQLLPGAPCLAKAKRGSKKILILSFFAGLGEETEGPRAHKVPAQFTRFPSMIQ